MLTACFSSSYPVCNVFCSEFAIASEAGNSEKRSWSIALDKTSEIIGEPTYKIARSLPIAGSFNGFVSIDGIRKFKKVVFTMKNPIPGIYNI